MYFHNFLDQDVSRYGRKVNRETGSDEFRRIILPGNWTISLIRILNFSKEKRIWHYREYRELGYLGSLHQTLNSNHP